MTQETQTTRELVQVKASVLVEAPPNHVRACEKMIHGMVQELLPGTSIETASGESIEIRGASVEDDGEVVASRVVSDMDEPIDWWNEEDR